MSDLYWLTGRRLRAFSFFNNAGSSAYNWTESFHPTLLRRPPSAAFGGCYFQAPLCLLPLAIEHHDRPPPFNSRIARLAIPATSSAAPATHLSNLGMANASCNAGTRAEPGNSHRSADPGSAILRCCSARTAAGVTFAIAC